MGVDFVLMLQAEVPIDDRDDLFVSETIELKCLHSKTEYIPLLRNQQSNTNFVRFRGFRCVYRLFSLRFLYIFNHSVPIEHLYLYVSHCNLLGNKEN